MPSANTELIGKSISELRSLLDNKEVKAVEIAEAHLTHAERFEPTLGAFNLITRELAIAQAKKVDELISGSSSGSGSGSGPASSSVSPLAGIPIALKDNICVAAYATTCSSKILQNFVPPYQATVTERLNQSGAVIIGKTNMDEFAMGSSNENSAFKSCKNPWNTKCVPGGSSGGSIVAVASGSSVVSLGSDTGGSVRQPASFCGVVGFKPTYGTISRFGLIAFASSLDQIGPVGRCVEDVAHVMNAISGHDPKDSTSYSDKLPNYVAELKKPVKGLKVGLITELIGEGIDEEVRQSILAAAEVLKELGMEIEEVSMPQLKHALPVYYILANAEASANLARFDGVRYGLRADADDITSMYFKTRAEGFGPEVKRRIMLGTYALSTGYYDAYYKKAQQVRRLIKNEFDKQFARVDLLISPTSPSVAFELGAKVDDPLTMYLSDIATIPANLAGLPAISIPCGFGSATGSSSGLGSGSRSGTGTGSELLPIGLQILAASLNDATALRAAHAFEQATDFHKKRPDNFMNALSSPHT